MKKLLFLPILFLISCDHSKPNLEYTTDMMESPSHKAQEKMRMPPEGTVAQNRPHYMFKGDPQGAENNLKNPLKGNEASLVQGKKMYEIYCMVCHGEKAKGDGPVNEKLALLKAPTFHSDKVKNFSDGRLFHIITEGQGLMGSYASQIPEESDRWSIVNYIRELQKGKE